MSSQTLTLPDATRAAENRLGDAYLRGRQFRARLLQWGVIALVFAPTALSTLYFGLIASPRYESETRFVVRSVGASHAAGGLAGFLQSFGIGRSTDEANAVVDYLGSRDAVTGLEAALPLRRIYAPDDADLLSRFPRPWSGDSFERLYAYAKGRIAVVLDPESGIVTLRVQAFRAEDAQTIALRLLGQAEDLVNAMNQRAEADAARSAEQAVAEATQTVLKAQQDLTQFRNAELVVDPARTAVAQLETITSLSAEVDRVLARLAETSRLAAANPAVAALRARAASLSAEIADEQKALAGAKDATAGKVSGYERLTLLRNLADASLEAATASLESARAQARRQRVFLEEIVAPNRPDEALLPRRVEAVATVFVVSMTALAMLWLVYAGARERRA